MFLVLVVKLVVVVWCLGYGFEWSWVEFGILG